MRRHHATVLLLIGFIVGSIDCAEAQQPKKGPRIGFIGSSDTATREAFEVRLSELGYIEGKTILFEYRYPQGKNELYSKFVAELIQANVDVLVITGLPGILAAKQATNNIPVVMLMNADPVAARVVNSLARPGGNFTGIARLTRELSGKRLELLKETIPGLSRVGILWDEAGLALDRAFKEYEAAAHLLKIQLQPLPVRGPRPDFHRAFQLAVKERSGGMITITDALLTPHVKQIADLATTNQLPSMHEHTRYVHAGGLMSYSANDVELYQRAATYVDKILKGTKPADLPVEQPTKFELVVI